MVTRALITSTGKVNSTRLRLVQLVALPLLVTHAINPVLHSIPYYKLTLTLTLNYTNRAYSQLWAVL